jgi:hypothetical protein
MPTVQLIHWKPIEAQKRVEFLRGNGYDAMCHAYGPAAFKQIRANPPDVFVIDLTRLPSHGRDVALAIRQSKSLRAVPLVFVDGDGETVHRIQQLLPDAIYTPWSRVRSALRRALANPPTDPIVPHSTLTGYSGTLLPKKLGIRLGSIVALVGARPEFAKTLGTLPPDVTLRENPRGERDLTMWFVRSYRDLERSIARMARLGATGMWIAWPRKTSSLRSDLSQTLVRQAGLAAGLVDYKVCAIDETWSGLKFTKRK